MSYKPAKDVGRRVDRPQQARDHPRHLGTGEDHFRYQWIRDGKAIPKAHGRTYSFTLADSGHVLAVAVTGDRSSYTAVTRISDGIAIP